MNLLPLPKQIQTAEGEPIRLNPYPDAAAPAFFGAADAFRAREDLFADPTGASLVLLQDDTIPDGGYFLAVTKTGAVLSAADVPGINHALATLYQLLERRDGGFFVPLVTVADEPDSLWRGFMIDLARQWHPVSYIYDYIDLCWQYKMSILQLHFTDDQSFTLPSKAFPKLSTPGRTYTEEEIAALRAYARDRGVILVPELDAPGHSKQFNDIYPEIFGGNGILCAEEKTFAALDVLYGELCDLFPDTPYVHIGGDEARIKHWLDCDGCRAWQEANGLKDEKEMYSEYVHRLTEMILSRGKTPVVWEGFPKEGNERIDKRTLVFSWENYYQPATDLAAGGFTLINAAWKPNYIVAPVTSWTPEEILDCDIYTFRHWWVKSVAFEKEIRLPETTPVIGGQLCAWGDRLVEMDPIDGAEQEFALVRRRLPAVAEKTWNVKSSCTPEQLIEAIDALDPLAIHREAKL